uniref:Uncharacterized protein n=1 Tax=Vitis vinifera TaxID=29760 RepID=F6HEN0_VITVI
MVTQLQREVYQKKEMCSALG